MPTTHADIARFADRADDTPRIYAAVEDHAHRHAQGRHPEHQHHTAAATTADRDCEQAGWQFRDTRDLHSEQRSYYGRLGHVRDPSERLTQMQQQITTTKARLAHIYERISGLEREFAATWSDGVGGHTGLSNVSPARLDHPDPDPVHGARADWAVQRAAQQHAARHNTEDRHSPALTGNEHERRDSWRTHDPGRTPASPNPGIDR